VQELLFKDLNIKYRDGFLSFLNFIAVEFVRKVVDIGIYTESQAIHAEILKQICSVLILWEALNCSANPVSIFWKQ
jgi:hypothetical protein